MKGLRSWHFNPYTRPTENKMKVSPYITRLSPMQFGFRFDYIDNGCPDERPFTRDWLKL